MKVFINILHKKDAIQDFIEELEMVIEEYYGGYQVYLIHSNIQDIFIEGCINIESNRVENNKVKAVCRLLVVLDDETEYKFHHWCGKDYLNKAETINLDVGVAIKEIIYKLNTRKWGGLDIADITNLKNNLLEDDSFSLLAVYLNKIERDSKIIFSLLDEIFIDSSKHSDGLLRALPVLDVGLFKDLKSEYFTKKNTTLNNPYLNEFYNSVYKVANNVVNQCTDSHNLNSRQLFKSFKSLANVGFHLALYKKNKRYSNQSYITLVRVLEFYFTGYLFMTGELVFRNAQGNPQAIYKLDGSKVNGFGAVWGIIKKKNLICSRDVSQLDKYKDLRNSHLYGHGFNLSGPNLTQNFITLVVNILNKLESSVQYRDNSWCSFSQLNSSLFNFNFKSHFKTTLLGLDGLQLKNHNL